MPLGVGAAAWMAPADENRAKGIRGALEPVRGYVLAPVIGGLLLFLAGVGIVRKARSARHRWSDTHIPIVVPPDGYDDTVDTIHDALADAGFPLQAKPASPLLSLPAWVLTHLAGPNVKRLRPDRVIELHADDIRVGIYPSDVAVSTTADLRTPIRATILAAISSSDAYLTTSAEAHDVEDRLKRITADAQDQQASRKEEPVLAAIDETLLALDIPNEEWDILYRLRLQAERDLLRRALGGTAVIDPLTITAADRAADAAPVDDTGTRREPRVAQVPAL